MARTNSNYFDYRKNLLGAVGSPTPLKILIANSTTLKYGQMVRVNTSGFVVAAGVGNAILGYVSGFIDNSGVPVNGFQYDVSKTGHTNSGDDTVVTASDNQSRAKAVFAEVVVPTEGVLLYNDASADLAQTNLMQLFDLTSSSDQVDQGTASDTSGQMQLVQLDPDNDGDASKGLFRVSEPQLLGHVGNSTAVVAA